MSVTGVTRAYDYTPDQLSTANMPSLFPRIPSQRNGIVTFTGVSGLDTVTVEMVAIVDATMQSTGEANFGATVALVDNLNAALKTEMAANQQIDGWEMRTDYLDIGTAVYWAVIATVVGSE